MNKLIIALMATAFAGSVSAADTVKIETKSEVTVPAGVSVTAEKPAAAPKAAHKHDSKKAAAKKAAEKKAAAKKAAAKKSADASAPAKSAPVADSSGKGESIYKQSCAVCHAGGVAGAPKLADKGAWAPRIDQGMEAMYASGIKGKGAMPAKGGNPALSDADVKVAVDYMVSQSR